MPLERFYPLVRALATKGARAYSSALTVCCWRLLPALIILAAFIGPKTAQALVGSQSAGTRWNAIIFLEIRYKGDPQIYTCSGFLLDDARVITAGHCVRHDEDGARPTTVTVCVGRVRPFNAPGEGCFETSRVITHPRYRFGSSTDIALITLKDALPLGFLGINPIHLISSKHERALLRSSSRQQFRVISFGSRNFGHPSLGKKGIGRATAVHYDPFKHTWQARLPHQARGAGDDGAGLVVRFSTRGRWYLLGLWTEVKPDYIIALEKRADPCAPASLPPPQPSLALSSTANFVSINLTNCPRQWLGRTDVKLCSAMRPSRKTLQSRAMKGDGWLAYRLAMVQQAPLRRLRWLKRASTEGYPQAQIAIALRLQTGTGMRRNPAQAKTLLTRAAGSGNAHAQWLLAHMHSGQQRGKVWLRKAAQGGEPRAQYTLAMSERARSSRNFYTWITRAARQGYAPAQYQLARAFNDGFGVKRDTWFGRQWMEFAAGQGQVEAVRYLTRHPTELLDQYGADEY